MMRLMDYLHELLTNPQGLVGPICADDSNAARYTAGMDLLTAIDPEASNAFPDDIEFHRSPHADQVQYLTALTEALDNAVDIHTDGEYRFFPETFSVVRPVNI